MVFKCGTIIPFQYKDVKRLIAIGGASITGQLTFGDVINAVRSAFAIHNCVFYNKRIGFHIPDELLVPYLEQCHDLTNFVIEIVGEEEDPKLDDPGIAGKLPNVVTDAAQPSIENNSKREHEVGGNEEVSVTKKTKQSLIDPLKTSDGKNISHCASRLERKEDQLMFELLGLSEHDALFGSMSNISHSRRYLHLAAAVFREFPGVSESTDGALSVHINDLKCSTANERVDCPKLETSSDDWVTYFKTWKESYEIRASFVRHIKQPLRYFEKFIAIAGDNAVELLKYDFERLHPGKGDKLLENWDKVSEIVFTEAIASCRNDVPLILDLYGNTSQLCGLMMLGYFLDNYENDVKPFEKNSPGNLLVHIESIDGSPADVFKKYCQRREQFHPMAFVTGTNADLSFYVVVADSLYSMETALKAIDFCFMCYQAMHLSYPECQKNVWQAVQSVLYNIKPVTDNEPACYKFLNIFESS